MFLSPGSVVEKVSEKQWRLLYSRNDSHMQDPKGEVRACLAQAASSYWAHYQ